MRKYNLLIVAIILLCIGSGCEKSQTEVEDLALIDRWKLVQISGGLAGNITKPTEDNLTILEFTKVGNYVETQNGQIEYQGKFSILKGKSIYSDKEVSLVKFEGSSILSSFNFKRDSLFLNEEVEDGFNYIYVRQK